MEKNIFVSDHFNTWQTCRKKYYYKYIKNLQIPEPANNFKFGKSMHALINYYLKGFDIEKLVNSADTEVQNVWNTISTHPILKNKVIATEWAFNAKVKNTDFWLNGRIDAIFFNAKTDKYLIIDWKTGQNIPRDAENSFQCMIYLYSFYKARKDLEIETQQENIAFNYVKISDDDVEICPISYSAKREEEIEQYLTKTINDINNETEFKPKKDCNEKHCVYQKLCFRGR